jgi:non-specific serine/threonine protein kinase
VRYITGALLSTVLLSISACTDTPDPAAPAGPASPPPRAATDATWRQLAPALSQRTEVAAAASGARIVVAGGYRADGGTVATTEILDTTTGRWAAGPDLPAAVNHAMAASVGDTVYLFGGYLANGRPTQAAYKLDGDAWRAVASMPQPRAAATAVAQDGKVYVAAGIGSAGLADEMLVYDPAADRWSTAPGPPTRREHLGGAGFGGLVYTVGGRTGGLNTNLSAFEAFDPRTGEWSTLPALPTRRGGLAATATCAGQIVAAGGEAAATFAEVEVFDIAAGTWKAFPPSPSPRHGLGVVALGNTVYTLSGGPKPGLHVADTTEAIDLGGTCR